MYLKINQLITKVLQYVDVQKCGWQSKRESARRRGRGSTSDMILQVAALLGVVGCVYMLGRGAG